MKDIGPEIALNELDFYSKSSEVSIEQIDVLIGAYSECEFTFCNGVKFVKPQNISDTYLAEILVSEAYNFKTPLPRVSSVLVKDFSQPIIHQDSTCLKSHFDEIDIPYKVLKTTRLILSLARNSNSGIFSIASTSIARDNLPFIMNGVSWSMTTFKIPGISPSIIEIELKHANTSIERFNRLDQNFQNKLRIPLERFNSYGSGEPMEDKAVDLRVCLESLFLGDGNKEQLRYRVSLRAALFLGDSLEERKKIFKIVRDSYDITSTVIHNGKFGSKQDLSILNKTSQLIRHSLIKLIHNGQQNWAELELS